MRNHLPDNIWGIQSGLKLQIMFPASSQEEGTKDFLDNLLLSHAFTTFNTELCTTFSTCNWSKHPLKALSTLVTQGVIGS